RLPPTRSPLGPRRSAPGPRITTSKVAAAMATRNTKPASRRATPRRSPTPMTAVHPDAAGIDVHSDLHVVCVPAGRDPDGLDVRSFGANTADLLAIADW